MEKLTEAQSAEIAALLSDINKATSDFEAAVEEYNTALVDLFDEVYSAQDAYNKAHAALSAKYTELAEEAQAYFDDKSERWQQNDTGQAYEEWIDQLAVDIDEVDVGLPDLIAVDLTSGDEIDLPPEEPDGDA